MEFKKNSLHKFEYHLMKKLFILDKNNLVNGGKILLNLQISGGLDSMCLLNAIAKIYYFKLFNPKNKFIFIAQHFNHKKRGNESDEDAALVVKSCLKLGIPIYQELFEDNVDSSLNFQDYARNWRKKKAIELSEKLKENLTCKKYFVVTAHHARDHVESVLMHLLRGCSLNGLLGIQEFDDSELFYRPFFDFEYEKMIQYQIQENVEFRQDSSNLKNDYERNYIRNQILPHFKKLKNSYEKSFQSMSNHVFEYLQNDSHKPNSLINSKIYLFDRISSSQIYEQLVIKNKELTKILTKNVIKNILHESELFKKSIDTQKEIKLALGWIVLLIKDNNNIEIDVFKKNSIK